MRGRSIVRIGLAKWITTMNKLSALAFGAAALAFSTVLLGLAGCATGPNPRDPFEPFNRKVATFNEEVDEAILKPVATTYRDTVPELARTGVTNFFGNLGDAWSAVNALLQLRIHYAAENWLRFSFNTVFGFAGVLDIATEMGVERHREDFGQTLGRWGVPAGPYLVLPLLGPSTVRDTAALPVDARGDLVHQFDPSSTENSVYVLRAVDLRANLLRASSMLEDVALDKYSFTRDAYLQLRQAEISNGRPSVDDSDAGGNIPPLDDEEGGQIPREDEAR